MDTEWSAFHHLSSPYVIIFKGSQHLFQQRSKGKLFCFSNCHSFVKSCWISQSFCLDLLPFFASVFAMRISVLKAGTGYLLYICKFLYIFFTIMLIGQCSRYCLSFALRYFCHIKLGLFWVLVWVCIEHLLLCLDVLDFCNIRSRVKMQYFIKELKIGIIGLRIPVWITFIQWIVYSIGSCIVIVTISDYFHVSYRISACLPVLP